MGRKRDPNREVEALPSTIKPGDTPARTFARMVTSPAMQAGGTAFAWMRDEMSQLTLASATQEFAEQAATAADGDLRRAEEMLTAQAGALDVMFHRLSRLARGNLESNINVTERLLRLALKAQSQSRATLETLVLVKNPMPTLFARQANVTTGPQQVNNGVACAGEKQREQSKVLEQSNGERLDPGAAGKAGCSDPALAPVGAVDRTEDTGR